jgi:hypothetical protein
MLTLTNMSFYIFVTKDNQIDCSVVKPPEQRILKTYFVDANPELFKARTGALAEMKSNLLALYKSTEEKPLA